ncbi:hypothetical protein [Rhizobium sp. L1K21]|nr:hypothetical protein [Rhizobium sp. L1K21]MCO6186661.1 hypothetical protein [Rhizobium sp. L1K21]
MKPHVKRPFSAIVDTYAAVKTAVSASQDYRRVAEMRRAGKNDISVLPL